MNQLVRFGLILGAICLVSTMVLAVTYEVTKPKIAAELKKEEDAALTEVMPEAVSFEPRTVDGIDYFEAIGPDGGRIGYCLKVTGTGYGGYIRMIAGIDAAGLITGVRVLQHQETPGLGSQISDVKPGQTVSAFLRQFAGKDATQIEVRKNIDAITGATISSKAVVDAVRTKAAAFLEAMRQ